MNRYRILALVITTFLISAGFARADETLKYRQILHAVAVQSQDVGDVDGHAVTAFRFSGLASFPDGTLGTATLVGTNDYIKGAGTNAAYFSLTLKDGSVLWYKVTGPRRWTAALP